MCEKIWYPSEKIGNEKFIKLLTTKLHEYPSIHRSMLWANGDCIAWVEYFSTETIIEAIRSILSPTKAKDDRPSKSSKDKKIK